MKLNFDLKNKNANIEADVEKLVEKSMDSHEKNWLLKFTTRNNYKKEMQELKHKRKLELKEKTRKKKKYEMEIENKKREKEELEMQKHIKNKKTIRNFSILLIFIYGLFCITGFRDNNIIPAIISLIQVCLLVIVIFLSEDIFFLFKKDYKILFIISILLTIVWLAFA